MSFDQKIYITRIVLKLLLLGPRVSTKPDFGDPSLRRLRKLLKGKKWDRLNSEISNIKSSSDYTQTIIALSKWLGRPQFINLWRENSPDISTAYLVSGAHAILWAWEGRTSNLSENVSDESWGLFGERLEFAENELIQAYKLNKKCADPFTHMIVLGMGRGDDADIIFEYFIKACQLNPGNQHAHHNMLYALTEKWEGSHEQMFNFARTTCDNLSKPSALHALIPQAHIEYWNYIYNFDEEREKANNYIRSRVVKDEINSAYSKSDEAMQALPASLENFTRGIFASAFYLSGQFERSKIEIDKLGEVINEYPWQGLYKMPRLWEIIDPGYPFGRIRREVKRKTQRTRRSF